MKKKKAKAKAKPKAKKAKKTLRAKVKPKKAAKKPAKKAKAKKKSAPSKPKMTVIPPPNSKLIGRVEDFYAHINVIAFTVKEPIRVGDRIHVLGHTTNIEQTIDSMQINHQSVSEARAKDAVGIKVGNRARRGDYIFVIRG